MTSPLPRTLHLGITAAALAVLLAVLVASCGESPPAKSDDLTASFGDPCRHHRCSGFGSCVEDDGAPACACDEGYAGAECADCALGFHFDSMDRCVPDRSCGDSEVDPCGRHGECDDGSGVIACNCDMGYEGPRCTLCISGYGRNEHDECLQLVIGDDDGPVEQGGTGGDGDMSPQNMQDGGVPNPIPVSCEEDTCNGHGSCEELGEDVRCLCAAGYESAQCESCAAGFTKVDAECAPVPTCDDLECVHGTCNDDFGLAFCTCDTGHTGRMCMGCAVGYHEDGAGHCVLDQSCTPNSCGPNATCNSAMGTVTCSCKAGYTGESCDGCAAGYYRHYASGTCKPFDCNQNPIKTPVTIDFETQTDFPTLNNNCFSFETVVVDAVTFLSIQGDGTVWGCGPSNVYALPSKHITISAGVLGSARMAFSGLISSLSFDYAVYQGNANVAFFADGVSVGTLMAARYTSGAVSFEFVAPISLFEIRSQNTTSQLAIDDVAFAPPPCP